MKTKDWWGKPTKREWLLYFFILLIGFLILSLVGILIGMFVILIFRKYYKGEEITKEHIGTTNELILAVATILLIIVFYLFIFPLMFGG